MEWILVIVGFFSFVAALVFGMETEPLSGVKFVIAGGVCFLCILGLSKLNK